MNARRAWRARTQAAQSAAAFPRRAPARLRMPYTVTVDEQHRLVEVVYSGPITVSTRICAMEDGATQLEAHKFTRVLVDLREARAVSEPLDAANAFATRIAHRPRLRDSRLAYVTRPDEHSSLRVQNPASARHVAVSHFHDRDEALHWLLKAP